MLSLVRKALQREDTCCTKSPDGSVSNIDIHTGLLAGADTSKADRKLAESLLKGKIDDKHYAVLMGGSTK